MNDYTKWHQSQPDIGLDEAIERIEGRTKAILVMDMPETCMDCKLWSLHTVGRQTHYFCKMIGRKWELESPNTARDSRCPLALVPEREDTISTYKLRQFAEEKGMSGVQASAWKRGWNACLDAILGGDEDG